MATGINTSICYLSIQVIDHYRQGTTLCWYQDQPVVPTFRRNFRFWESVRMDIIFFEKLTTFEKKKFSFEKKIPLKKIDFFLIIQKVGTNFGTTGWSWYQHSVVPCSSLFVKNAIRLSFSIFLFLLSHLIKIFFSIKV